MERYEFVCCFGGRSTGWKIQLYWLSQFIVLLANWLELVADNLQEVAIR